MSKITNDELRATLTSAVDQHTWFYTRTSALSIRWAYDNTDAEKDVKHFQKMLGVFNLAPAEEFVIPKDDVNPGYNVGTKFLNVLRSAIAEHSRTLVVVHYAGHGDKDANDLLMFTSNLQLKGGCTQSFGANKFLFELTDNRSFLFEPDASGDQNHVDVLYILNSCYSHLATQAAPATGSIIQVLATVDATNPVAFGPTLRSSFTSKLLNEITARRNRGEQGIDFSDLIGDLRNASSVKIFRVGASSIKLRFSASHDTAFIPRPSHRHVILQVDVADDYTNEELKDLVN
jgi:hypothetical protein